MQRNISLRKIFISSYLGNTLETYDFVLSGILAGKMSQVFFPSENHAASLLLMLAAYGVGFVSRPLGAIFFGYIGDTWGRKTALFYSLMGMSLCTLAFGLLPSYETIGISASVLLFLIRILQGVCIGGESQGGSVFIVEHFWKKSPAAFGAFFATSNGLGALLATLTSLLFLAINPEDSNVWRYPFILGALVGGIGFYIRRKTPETPSFVKKVEGCKVNPVKASLTDKKNCLRIFLYFSLISSITHFGFTFVNIFLNNFAGFSKNAALVFACIGTLLATGSVATTGLFLKKFPTSLRNVVHYGVILAAVLSPFVLPMMQSGVTFNIYIALIFLACFTGMLCGAAPYFIAIHFNSLNRYSGSSLMNNLAQGFIGGFFPSIALFLINATNQVILPGLYISTLSLIFMGFNYFCKDLQLYEKA